MPHGRHRRRTIVLVCGIAAIAALVSLTLLALIGDGPAVDDAAKRLFGRIFASAPPMRAVSTGPPAQDLGPTDGNWPGRITGLVQVNQFATGFDARGAPHPVPAIDPAGITFHGTLGGLLIADSEITEVADVFEVIGATHFLASPDGSGLVTAWDFSVINGVEPEPNLESTGIAWCAFDDHVYVTNDDTKMLYQYRMDGPDFRVTDFVSTAAMTRDPEGVTCDPKTGRIYVVGGTDTNIVVFSYADRFVFLESFDINATAGNPAGELPDIEGVAFDPVTRHLLVVSDPAGRIVEYGLGGVYVRHFELSALTPAPVAPQGIAIGPSSNDPGQLSIYLADGGIDNDQDPDERDGAIYELRIIRVGK